MSLHSLPVFLRLAGRPVILIGDGAAATAKRRLLERAGAVIVGEDDAAALAIVACDDPDPVAARLKTRGLLVNVADRPNLCDFTLPAIVDRSPVVVAVGTGGASAGLAAALRQRLEALLPTGLGRLAEELHRARAAVRAAFPDADERRRALAVALGEGGSLDPLGPSTATGAAIVDALATRAKASGVERIVLTSPDPDDLTLRQARALALADRVVHGADVPAAILDRARADAVRMVAGTSPVVSGEGLTVVVEMNGAR